MKARYPAYDVLDKRGTPSWDEVTRAVLDERLGVHPGPRFFTADEWPVVKAVCVRILPQPSDRPTIPLAAYVDKKLLDDERDGYRRADLPPQREAWRRGMAALQAEANAAYGRPFEELASNEQDDLLSAMQAGRLNDPAWGGMPSDHFFTERILADVTRAYYAHPIAWNEIGFGGPASPRGYVRMGLDRHDPWEAAEALPGKTMAAQRKNRRVGDR